MNEAEQNVHLEWRTQRSKILEELAGCKIGGESLE